MGGLAIVFISAELTVSGVLEMARILNVDDALVAILAIGLGTSLPELSISLSAILKRRSELSVGNLIGSNIFDTLVPVGVAATISELVFDRQMLQWDLPYLFLLSLFVLIFLRQKSGMRKRDAMVILSMYGIYVLMTVSAMTL